MSQPCVSCLLLLATLPLAGVELTAWSHAGGWIAEPGSTSAVELRLAGVAPAQRLRLELRSLDGRVQWSEERAAATTQQLLVDTSGCVAGDHGLRLSVLAADGSTLLARERALMLAGPEDLVLVFDHQPVARGLGYDRSGIRPVEVTVDGATTWIHEMGYDSRHGAEGWWRSLLLTLEAEGFRHGQRPVADIELVYRHSADAPVELLADTAAGSRKIAAGWGRQEGWQRLQASIGDARFAAPELDADPAQRLTDGCDLRFNACTADGQIRSILIHAPDASAPADWSRFLSASGFSSEAGWVLAPGGQDRVELRVANNASANWNGRLRFEHCAASGKVLHRSEQDFEIPAGGEARHHATLTTVAASPGEQLLRWRLLSGPAERREQDIGWERSAMVAEADRAFILFEREPIARGLEFSREHVEPVQILSKGLYRWIWKANHGSASQGWWRSVRMTFTDDRFRAGAAPVVDVDLCFLQRADAPVNLAADTRHGPGVVASSWGSRGPGYEQDPPWKHLRASIDDAVFAATGHAADPDTHPADGCDLRYNACTRDGEIRSVVVRRYDLEQDPDWERLLRTLGVDCGKDRYIFQPGQTVSAQVKLANRARIPYRSQATVRFTTDLDHELWSRSLAVEIPAESDGSLEIPIDTAGLPYGVYVLHTEIGEEAQTTTLIGLSDETPLPKAEDGEFLYGTDLGGHFSDSRKLDWADFMGIDIVRNLARGESDAEVDAAMEALRARGLRGTIMCQPAWNPDPVQRAAANAGLAAWIGEVAKRHGDALRWYELGNEPDLPFFYAGPIEAYVEGYLVLHAAIKANDPDSVVMNGGLCFHGDDGWRRAHELIAQLPEDTVDAWAYHGHGPGIGAERGAWERQDRAVRAVGKGDRDYIETESGFAARDLPGCRRQAQTIVQKMVFAQSKQAPLFLWFNLHMGESEWYYTTIERLKEPRPAVLAHRAMVKVLRGLHHAAELDLLAPEAEAHLFAADDGRRALVLWSDHGEITRTIAIGPDCSDLQRSDLFGNTEAHAEATPGLVQIAVDADPVFVTWTAGDPAYVVTVPPPPLAVPDRLRVVPGRPVVLPVTIRNPGSSELTVELTAEPVGAVPVHAPDGQTVTVAAGGRQETTLQLTVDAVTPSTWPRQWTVFAPVDGELDLAELEAIPSEVLGVAPQLGIPAGLELDLGRIADGHRERKQAICFATIDSDREQTVEFGAGADWWMEWYVNGERVYSTMDRGNQGPYQVLTHVFPVTLRQGRNLIAVRVLSGSGGWRLVAGGPEEVATARRERSGVRDALRLDLRVDGKLLAREPLPVELLHAVDRIEGRPEWSALPADGSLGSVHNRFAATPDSRKWHQGADDLSARIWLRHTGDQLRLAVAVRDELVKPGDRCRVELASGARLEQRSRFEHVQLQQRRDDATATTWYELAIPRERIGLDRFAIRVVVEDDDWGELKQHAAWGEGQDPEAWHQGWLAE